MTRITSRFVLLIASAAIAPLMLYGAVSVAHLSTGTEQSVREGNLRVAEQVGEQIGDLVHNQRVPGQSGWSCGPPTWSFGSRRGS